MNKLTSRIRTVIFADDMCNFIEDGGIDNHLQIIAKAIYNNSIVNLKIKEDVHKQWLSKDMDDIERCNNISLYLQAEGGYLVQIETPIPYDIKKYNDGIRSWSSSGFGHYTTKVFYIKNFENIKLEILEYEKNMFKEIYEKEQSKQIGGNR